MAPHAPEQVPNNSAGNRSVASSQIVVPNDVRRNGCKQIETAIPDRADRLPDGFGAGTFALVRSVSWAYGGTTSAANTEPAIESARPPLKHGRAPNGLVRRAHETMCFCRNLFCSLRP